MLFLPNIAFANDLGAYTGISYGYSKFEGDSDFDNSLFEQGSQFEDKDGTVKFIVGYKLNKFLSFEANYIDFDKMSDRFEFRNDIVFIPGHRPDNSFSLDVKGISIAPLVTYDLHKRIAVYAKFGLSILRVHEKSFGGYDWHRPIIYHHIDEKDTEYKGFGGLGFKFSVIGQLHLRFEYERYKIKNNDVNTANIAIIYHF
jgi:opacity protein-like surface antigen